MISFAPSLPLQIDSSMLVTFRSCPRKFFWEYVNCLRPAGRKVDLVAGGAFAAALERAYEEFYVNGVPEDLAIARSYDSFRRTWNEFEDDPNSAKSFSRMFQAVQFYFERFGLAADHFQPFRAEGRPTFEFSFALPLEDSRFPRHPSGDPFVYTGRFDALGHFNGHVAVRDEKTTGRNFTRDWAATWDLRNQFIGYVWACQQLGFPVKTVVVRGICIQKTQFNVAEAIKIYSNELLKRFELQLARDLHRLVQCWNDDWFDFNFGDTCTAYGRPCSFSVLCSSDRPEVWFNDFDRERWDPISRTSVPLEA